MAAVVAVLLGAVGPLETVLPVTDPGAEEAGFGNVAGGLGACAAGATLLFCTALVEFIVPVAERPTILEGRGRVAGMAADVLGDSDMVALGGSFLGAEVDAEGPRDCRFVAVEVDAPGALAVVVGALVVDGVVPESLAPGARDCRGLEADCDNDCLWLVDAAAPVVPVALLTGAVVDAVPLLRDAAVETGFIFEGVPPALTRLCFVLGDSCEPSVPLSAAEVEAWAADTMVPSALTCSVLGDSAGTVCCDSGL